MAVRVRPENSAEESNGAHRNVVEIVDERMLVFDPKQGRFYIEFFGVY